MVCGSTVMNHLTMRIRSEKSVTMQFRQATIVEAMMPTQAVGGRPRPWGANLGCGGVSLHTPVMNPLSMLSTERCRQL